MQDPRITALITVTRVEVTGDLALARVYLSVQGDEHTERRTIAALRHARGFVQRKVAQALSIRQCPEVRFEIDEAVKGARRTMELLEENRRREPELHRAPGQICRPMTGSARCWGRRGGWGLRVAPGSAGSGATRKLGDWAIRMASPTADRTDRRQCDDHDVVEEQ